MTYGQAAKFYDLFGSKNDLEFYREHALASGNKALELGVGTGRVAISFARAGHRVVGIDNSVHMLNVAREKLTKETPEVRKRVILKRGDMRTFELSESFPYICIPASTFDHNVTVEEQRRTLNCIYKHLEKNGTFAFDLQQTVPSKPETSWWIDRREIKDGKLVVRSVFTRRSLTTHACTLDLFFDVYRNSRLLDRYHEHGEVALISKSQITTLLEQTGFKVRSLYRDFDGTAYRRDSSHMVIVAKRK
jgi:ubiquinone/menaquinone biosynthesis C-methylase UbiE